MAPSDSPPLIRPVAPATVKQGIGPLFTPPYVYVMLPVVALVAVVAVPLLPVGGGGEPFAMIPPLLIFGAVGLLVAVGSLWPMRLLVGNDGVLVSWLFLYRFISYRDLAEVDTHTSARCRGLVFVTRKGVEVPMPIQVHIATFGVGSENLEEIESLMEHIGELARPIAMRVNERGDPTSTDPMSTDPMGLVADAGAPSEERVSAARQLADALDDDKLKLLAVTAAASADPGLRRVLLDVVQSQGKRLATGVP